MMSTAMAVAYAPEPRKAVWSWRSGVAPAITVSHARSFSSMTSARGPQLQVALPNGLLKRPALHQARRRDAAPAFLGHGDNGVQRPASDAEGERGMLVGKKRGYPQPIERPTAFRCVVQQVIAHARRYEHVVHRAIAAARALQAYDMPVVMDMCLGGRERKHAVLGRPLATVVCDECPEVDPVRMSDAARKCPAAM